MDLGPFALVTNFIGLFASIFSWFEHETGKACQSINSPTARHKINIEMTRKEAYFTIKANINTC